MGKGAAGGMTGVGRGVTIPVSPPPMRPMVTSGGVGVLPPSGMTPLQGAPGPVVGPVSPPPMNATGTANMGLGASAQTTVPPIQPDFTEMMGPGVWDQAKAYGAGMSGFSPAMELGNPNVVPPIGPNLPQNIPAPARGVGPKVRDFSPPMHSGPEPAPQIPQSFDPNKFGPSGGVPTMNPNRTTTPPMQGPTPAAPFNRAGPPSMPTPSPERGGFRALMDAGEGSPPPVSAPEVPQAAMGSPNNIIEGMFGAKSPPPMQPKPPTPLSEVPFSGRPVNEVGPNRLTPPVPAGPPGQAQPVSAPPQRPPVQNAALPVNEPLTPLSAAPIQTQRTPADIHALKAGIPSRDRHLFKAEGTANYRQQPGAESPFDVVIGFGQYGLPPKPITQMSFGDLYKWQRSILPNPLDSTASGAYQITSNNIKWGDNLSGYMKEAGLTLDSMFTPENQRRLAAVIAKHQGTGAWQGFSKHPTLKSNFVKEGGF